MEPTVQVLLVAIVMGAGAALAGHPTWLIVPGCALGGIGAWRVARCRHPRPLGLLPPTVDPDGVRHPSQWFCASCGEAWPAIFEHANPPRRRFEGYDPIKPLEAAKRAAALELRTRELAVQRAGLDRPPAKPRRRPEPVPIQSRRAAG